MLNGLIRPECFFLCVFYILYISFSWWYVKVKINFFCCFLGFSNKWAAFNLAETFYTVNRHFTLKTGGLHVFQSTSVGSWIKWSIISWQDHDCYVKLSKLKFSKLSWMNNVNPVFIIQKFLTKPFLQKFHFVVLEILTSKQMEQVSLFSF